MLAIFPKSCFHLTEHRKGLLIMLEIRGILTETVKGALNRNPNGSLQRNPQILTIDPFRDPHFFPETLEDP